MATPEKPTLDPIMQEVNLKIVGKVEAQGYRGYEIFKQRIQDICTDFGVELSEE